MLILSFNLSKKFIGFGASFVKKTIAMGRRSKKRHANLLDFLYGKDKSHINKKVHASFLYLYNLSTKTQDSIRAVQSYGISFSNSTRQIEDSMGGEEVLEQLQKVRDKYSLRPKLLAVHWPMGTAMGCSLTNRRINRHPATQD